MKIIHSLSLAALISACSFSAFAASGGHYNNTMTKDWNGYREKLFNQGIDIKPYYKVDGFYNTNGGLSKGDKFLDRAAFVADLDGKKMLKIPGLTSHIAYYTNSGGNPDELVGSVQGTDAMSTRQGVQKARFYEAFLQQNLLCDKVSILFGLRDINNEFFYAPSTDIFIHEIDDIDRDPTISSSLYTSIAPFSSTLRLKVTPNKDYYVQAAVLDRRTKKDNYPGVAGFNHLIVAEAGLTPTYNSHKNKFALGYWHYKDRFPVYGNSAVRKQYQGFYLLADSQIYKENDSSDQGLSSFVKIKFGDRDVGVFDHTINAGLLYKGLVPNRDASTLALAIIKSHFAKKYRKATLTSARQFNSSETTYELTYSDNLLPWLTVQPDLQYVVNPASGNALKNATVVGLRLIAKI